MAYSPRATKRTHAKSTSNPVFSSSSTDAKTQTPQIIDLGRSAKSEGKERTRKPSTSVSLPGVKEEGSASFDNQSTSPRPRRGSASPRSQARDSPLTSSRPLARKMNEEISPRRPISQHMVAKGAISAPSSPHQALKSWEPTRMPSVDLEKIIPENLFIDLPAWKKIFTFVPPISFYTLSCTSKLFNAFIWSYMFEFKFGNCAVRKMVNFIRRCNKQTLKTIDFTGCLTVATPLLNVAGFPNLSTIILANCLYLRDQDLDRILNIPQLSKLNLSNCTEITNNGFEKVNCPLTHLNLSSCFQLKTLKHISSLTGLLHLNLANCVGLNEDEVSSLSSLIHLEYLNLRHIPHITKKVILSLKDLKELKFLNLAWCRMQEDAIMSLADCQFCKTLEYLNIASNSLTDKNAKIFESFQNLKYLNCAHSVQLTDAGIGFLVGLHELERVNFCGCIKLTDLTITQLSVISRIQHFILSQTAISERTISLIEVNFPALTHLSIPGCPINSISAQGLEYSRIKFLNLQNTTLLDHSPLRFLTGNQRLRYLNIFGVFPNQSAIRDEVIRLQPKFEVEFCQPVWDGREQHHYLNEQYLATTDYYADFNSAWLEQSDFFK